MVEQAASVAKDANTQPRAKRSRKRFMIVVRQAMMNSL